jgi:hypothetical protein
MKTLRDILVDKAVSGIPILDQLEKKSGIAMTAGFIPASNGTFHKWKMSGSLPSATIRLVGGSVTGTSTNNTLGRQDLQEFTMFHPEDWKTIGELGGGRDQEAAERFFLDNYPQDLEGMLQTISKQIIYGTNSTFGNTSGFNGLHDYAKSNSKRTQLGGATGSRTSIFVVRWNPKFCSILLNPNVIAGISEVMTSTRPAFNPSTTNVTTGAKQPTWETWHTSDMGLMVASNVSVWAITQADDSNYPTAAEMMAALRGVHSERDLANTKIYCNERGRDMIYTLNDTNLISTDSTDKYDNRIMTFNGVEIVVDENISDVETDALD